MSDRFAAAKAVADATLYEGYVLYPYRASAQKNQLRWQFGVVVPPDQVQHDPSERSFVRTECVIHPGATPVLYVRIRCLQAQHRAVEPGPELRVGDTTWVDWDEAVEHELDLPPIALRPMPEPLFATWELPGGDEVEILTDSVGAVAGRLVRHREPVAAEVRVEADRAPGPDGLIAVRVNVLNTSKWSQHDASRDDVVRRSLVAVHTLLAVDDGVFVSHLDPPDLAADAIRACNSEGTWPVLIDDTDTVVLSSPIILYDHPAIAPESPGDLYDVTEIDEILALRVVTLTDDEKAEARGTDRRSAAIVERCEDLTPEMWDRLHGTVRETEVPWWDPGADAAFDPATDTVFIGGVEIGAGTKVRLQPSRRADAHDLFLAGMDATVAGVFNDVDGGVHVAVVLDDDPGRAELAWQGRYLYFQPDELELLTS